MFIICGEVNFQYALLSLSDEIASVSLDISQLLSEEGPGVVILFCG